MGNHLKFTRIEPIDTFDGWNAKNVLTLFNLVGSFLIAKLFDFARHIVNIPQLIAFFSIWFYWFALIYTQIPLFKTNLRRQINILCSSPYIAHHLIGWVSVGRKSYSSFRVLLGNFMPEMSNVMSLMCAKLKLIMWTFQNESELVCMREETKAMRIKSTQATYYPIWLRSQSKRQHFHFHLQAVWKPVSW